MAGQEMLYDNYLNETHYQFLDSCRRFAKEEILPYIYEWEEAEEFPRELYKTAANAGILGATFPVELGGGGGDSFHSVLFAEGIMTAGSTGVLAGLSSIGIALPPILNFGTKEQIERFIPPVLAGDRISCLAITEPNTGSDVAGIQTRAERKGDHYILNGSKTFITNGVRAEQTTLLARTGPHPHKDLTFFVVDANSPGYVVSSKLKKMGWRASDTAELAFNDVKVPVENRIGEDGQGLAIVKANFVAERLRLAAYGHATSEIALAEAERYVRERKAFGKPLLDFQVIQHKIARMATLLHASKSFNYQITHAEIRGLDIIEQVAAAKNFSAEAAMEVCDHAVQIFGGMGFMRETMVERLFRDVRLLSIGGGTSEIMNEMISRERKLKYSGI